MVRVKVLASISVVLLAAAVVSAGALNSPVAPGQAPQATGTITDLSGYTDCVQNNEVTFTIHITGTTDDGGGEDQIAVQIWDDGVIKVQQTYNVAVDATVDITDTLHWSGPIGEGALGVGVVVADLPSGDYIDYEDPFVLDGEDQCGDITPTPIVPVPTTGPTGLLALIGLLAAAGVFVLLRRR